jgi:hypothetical protein
VDYFNVIMTYANNDIGKENKLFLLFKRKQNKGIEELQPTEGHKKFDQGFTFMDMLLLTLPEKIMQCCHEKEKEESIVPPNEFHFTAKYKGLYNPNHLPTINTFIPIHLQPSTILANDDMVTNYSTPQLLAIGNKKPAGKKKK